MKALSVFSGGLDSILAASLVRAQGIDTLGIFFKTPFFSSVQAEKSARSIDLPLKVLDITPRHLEIVRHPRHGYGGNMNPCIDCHALMLRIAGELLEEENADFIVTGEVLGQRPMSQNMASLKLTARESGFAGLVLRPLSAKRLPLTIPEEKGWIDRDLLMDFQGRSRKPQMQLAKRLGITYYPSPAGGCLLTEEVFSRRLKDLFESSEVVSTRDIELLKTGRHFRVGPGVKVVVGRNEQDNKRIHSLADDSDLVLTTVNVPGPTALVAGRDLADSLPIALAITAAYSDAKPDSSVKMRVRTDKKDSYKQVKVKDKREFRSLMI